MKILVLIWCFVVGTLAEFDIEVDDLDDEVKHQCNQHCPMQNRTVIGSRDGCDYECSMRQLQCEKGCKNWRTALNSSCPKICNGYTENLTQKDLYCVMGCNDAMTKYFSQLRTRLGTPPPPALVADSLNSTYLKLEWSFPQAKKTGLSYHVQWKYEELTASWQYCRNATWNLDKTIVLVTNLQPYTKYRFRVALVPGNHGEPIYSAASVVISTLPSGVPASPPIIVRAAAVDCTRISVSWEPGPFLHGPLLSYVIEIADNHPRVHSEVKDIPPEINHYMVRNLSPSTTYNVSISMRNNVGLGPPAKVSVSTPPEPLTKTNQLPMLILGTEHSIIEQGTFILDEPLVLYETEKSIKGTAVHIRRKTLFVSQSDGNVIKMNLFSKNPVTLLSPNRINFKPLDLSIDWLNDQLYILGEVRTAQKMWQIARCNLDGGGLTVAVAGLIVKPHCIEVDPYNGYLFWAMPGYSKGGLYRLDLADISNGIKHEIQPEMILKDSNLGSFTLDHTNFRLLVAKQRENTIHSVSLDGKETTNLRPKVIKSKMHKVISLGMANNKFYWTDGDNIFYEEYRDSYFHNSYPDLSTRSYKKVIINLESSQPIPTPVNPPTNVQAVFGDTVAKTSWHPPHLLGGQGRGAWQNWSYEVSFRRPISNEEITLKGINLTYCQIEKLRENSKYIVKVAAYTSYGKGPWSSEFRGQTLDSEHNPVLLWSASEGLLRSDATGQNVETLIHGGGTAYKNFYLTDVAWHKGHIYMVNNKSQVHWYDVGSHQTGRLLDIDSIGSIAIDWIGMKLYWSNPKQQLIIRGNLRGGQQEPLPILTLAKELNIDALKAYIYWSTGYAVECSHLNGADRMEYHDAQLFSGKQVMGLTLDMDHKYVFWIVRGSEGSNLFKAPMAGYWDDIVVEKVSSLQKPDMQGPLCYFHNRLLWLQDDHSAAISDLEGRNIAIISGKTMTDLTLIYVVDEALQPLPSKMNDTSIVVIPEVIDKNSVKVVGSADSFNVSWKPVENVNYGEVFYEVQIENLSRNDSTMVTRYNSIKYWQNVTPYTKLDVSLKAFTYWGSSQQIRVKIFSPPSTPSEPRNLRTYVTYQRDFEESVSVTFRWDLPLYPNGVVQGYKVHCWRNENREKFDVCGDVVQNAEEMEFVASNLQRNETYYFQVQAFTNIGDGKLSEIIAADARQETPLPKLLLASTDSIFIQDFDVDHNDSVIHDINTPKQIGYSLKENKIIWINQMRELLIYDRANSLKTKLLDLQGEPNSLTVDWLERSVYFTEETSSGGLKTAIRKIDLNLFDKDIIRVETVIYRDTAIFKIEISPYTKKLYWIEKWDFQNYELMKSNTDGTDVEQFFPRSNRKKRKTNQCNCFLEAKIDKTFTVDHSDAQSKPLLVFIDSANQNVVAADKNACLCAVIANKSVIGDAYPLDAIKSDFGNFYWTNPDDGILYALKKRQSSVTSRRIRALDISIFGHHTQPFPPEGCLGPRQDTNATVSVKRKTSNSLILTMPDYEIGENCAKTSIATVEYVLHYGEYEDWTTLCPDRCKKLTTFDKNVEIGELKPFTEYLVSVGVRNFYTKNDEVNVGPPIIVRTAPGAPSPPVNVTTTVLNPNLAKVSWYAPLQLNGDLVYYEIHWQTESTLSGVRKKEEQPLLENNFSSEPFVAYLRKLAPNETYVVWVRAYCETNETSSDSERVKIVTYPEPNGLVLVNKTSSSLRLAWVMSPHIASYVLQYKSLMTGDWDNASVIRDEGEECLFEIAELKPKNLYKVRLLLSYEDHDEPYIWPTDSRFTFETLGDKPSPPGTPIIQYFKPNVYKVWWEAAKDNGAPIELYKLEGMVWRNYRNKRSTNRSAFYYSAPSIEEEEREWVEFYNGTETSWIISGLSDKYKYIFRAFALNSYGWSDPSKESTEFDLNEAARMADKQSAMTVLFIATCIVILFIILVVISVILFTYSDRCTNKKKEGDIIALPRGPDVELATLRELPRRGVHNTNVLYVSAQPTPEDLKSLPHIRRDQITLTKFLGSGAFGEVFEGKAKRIGNSTGETKVAVKTLRKGASDQEKTEFLQEAQLMSHFKHEHILELLGVCLDNDPHFIIMELMQGGDLLTYLRSSRNPASGTPSLRLIELLKMCVDVAKGCRYLEEMHFVHRDLACRNCLVSSTDPNYRIVKIGDFGLARDIYKNDYYRKEGEGLLPVRWMAPESLVDGVFTCQSDVWAFGVLLWEIMTLGQQPYPARNNLEVLHYVRRGGRLGKPVDCPKDLYSLMLKCWEFDQDNRPTFKYCFEVLVNLHHQNLRSPTTGAHEGQYISTVPDQFNGISNAAYFRDENYNSSGLSWKSNVEEVKEKTPFLPLTETNETIGEIPKYLELLYEGNSESNETLDNDGYEIPTRMLKNSECGDTFENARDGVNSNGICNGELDR